MMRKFVLVAAVMALVGVAGTASAAGVTPDQLTAAGWTCFTDPAAPRTVCSDPGHGRPIPGDSDALPSYNFKIFTLDGSFVGTVHLLRSDLYQGQPCPPTDAPYFFHPRYRLLQVRALRGARANTCTVELYPGALRALSAQHLCAPDDQVLLLR